MAEAAAQDQEHLQIDLRSEPFKKQALELAKFLRHNAALKNKSGVLDGKRVEYFKGKYALKALQSEAYKKAGVKNTILPKIECLQDAGEAMRLLPIHLLALRVDALAKEKPKKGSASKPARKLQINRQQEINPDHHYVWFYEYIPLLTKLAGFGILALVLAVIMYPLWPPKMRVGVYYLSWGALGLVGLLIVIAIVRLILYVITMFAVPPGIWLYPNLFEDVGFFDSFRPLWAWHEDKKKAKKAKKEKREKVAKVFTSSPSESGGATPVPGQEVAHSTAAEVQPALVPRHAYVEEAEDDE